MTGCRGIFYAGLTDLANPPAGVVDGVVVGDYHPRN
jgi:hypothetical protein